MRRLFFPCLPGADLGDPPRAKTELAAQTRKGFASEVSVVDLKSAICGIQHFLLVAIKVVALSGRPDLVCLDTRFAIADPDDIAAIDDAADIV